MTPIPVFQTAIGAYLYLWQERIYLWQLTMPPIVILSILGALVQWGTTSSIETTNSMSYTSIHRSGWVAALFYITFLISIWIWLSFSVAWHRKYLLGGNGNGTLNAYRWSRRQFRFLGTAIKIFLLMIPALFIFTFLVTPAALRVFLIILGLMAYAYIYARLLIWFPAVAVDQQLDIRSLWQLSQNNGWRLLSIIAVVSMPLIVLSLLAYLITGPLEFISQFNQYLSVALLSNLLFKFLSFMELAASISGLSIAYQYFVDRKHTHLDSNSKS